MKITMTFDDIGPEQAAELVRVLASAKSADALPQSQLSFPFPAAQPPRPAPVPVAEIQCVTQEGKAGKKQSAKASSAESATPSAPPAVNQSAAPTPSAPVADADSTSGATIEEVRSALQALQMRRGVPEVKALLDSFGSPVLKKIAPERYLELIAAADALV